MEPSTSYDIAIIGMAGRFCRASDLEQFWRNLENSVEAINELNEEDLLASGVPRDVFTRSDYVRRRGYLDSNDTFDAEFFHMTGREAQVTDPQHRIFLEVAWEALEAACYDASTYPGLIGVFAGMSMNTYLLSQAFRSEAAQMLSVYDLAMGNDKDFLPTRVSYKFNLRGPSINVQSACSTSLVAVHLACQSLLAGECDMALAGAISLVVPQRVGYIYQEGGVASSDGRCRPFDASSQGTVGGEGVGIVVLKPLAEALAHGDTIHAVIKGSAINNDGARKVGYTAPSIEGQAGAIAEALQVADIRPEDLGYIEAHGTGTALGDPIEIASLVEAFKRIGARQPEAGAFRIGSVKSNLGHLDVASGMAGLLKTILCLEKGAIPATLHFKELNPSIDCEHNRFEVVNRLLPWNQNVAPRRAAVSSFGIGGTNAHIVLEQAPQSQPSEPAHFHLMTLSARTQSALDKMTDRLIRHLEQQDDPQIGDTSYSLQVGRAAFDYRRAFVCTSKENAIALAKHEAPGVIHGRTGSATPAVAFLFPGQGSHYAGMGQELYDAQPVFREEVDRLLDALDADSSATVRDALFARDSTADFQNTRLAQLALFVTEYALAKLWLSWGIEPQALCGHSIGEYVAACVADIFSPADAMRVVAARGQLMQASLPGAMLSVRLPEPDALRLARDRVSLAAVNAPNSCVLSGPEHDLQRLADTLKADGVICRLLAISRAFHSSLMDSVMEPLLGVLKSVPLSPPRIPVLSNLTGAWLTVEMATDPAYWTKHLRQPVRFGDNVSELLRNNVRLTLEVGPGHTLSTLVRQNPAAVPERVLASLGEGPARSSEVRSMLDCCGRLWVNGVSIRWSALHAGKRRRRIPLPTYPFERKRYWLDPKPTTADAVSSVEFVAPEIIHVPKTGVSQSEDPVRRNGPLPDLQPQAIEARLRAIVQRLTEIPAEEVGMETPFFEAGISSLLLVQFAHQIQEELGLHVPLSALFANLSSLSAVKEYLCSSAACDREQASFRPNSAYQEPVVVRPCINTASSEVAERPGATLSAPQKDYLTAFVQRYCERTKESKRLASTFRARFVDGRNCVGFNPLWKELIYPIAARSSRGSRITDVDDNEYVDLAMGFGVHLLGHSPEIITSAIRHQLTLGIQLGPQAELAGEVADLVCALTRSEGVLFTNSGTEAVMAALRIVRTVTRRDRIALFSGSYHGWSDLTLAQADGIDAARSLPSAPGIPYATAESLLVLPYAQTSSLQAIQEHAQELAAVLVEPVQSRRPDLQPKAFLVQLRKLTRDYGIPLIFDEMITGFRIHPGGAQAYFGIQADLATYGKIAGGGLPIGIVAGRRRFLDACDGGTWQFGDESYPSAERTLLAGTFCKHPLTMAAARAILGHLHERGRALQDDLNKKTQLLAATLNEMFEGSEVPLRIRHFGSQFVFSPQTKQAGLDLLPYHLVHNGIYVWEGGTCALSTAHTAEDLKRVVQAFEKSIASLQDSELLKKPTKVRQARPGPLPLTAVQHGVWVACQLSIDASRAYNQCMCVRLRGDLNAAAMITAIQTLKRQRDALCTSFSPDGAFQEISEPQPIPVAIDDLSGRDKMAREREAALLAAQDARAAFNLNKAPLFRARIVKLSDGDNLLVLAFHHLITDAWSAGILLKELGQIYKAVIEGGPLPRSSASFREYIAAEDVGENPAEEYWVRQFSGQVPLLNLPLDRRRPRSQTYRAPQLEYAVPHALQQQIRKTAGTLQCTMFTLLFSGFLLQLHSLTRQRSFVIGLHAAGQPGRAEEVVGLCTTVLPFLSRFDGDETVGAFVRSLQLRLTEAYDNRACHYSKISQRLGLKRDPARPPLVTAVFNVDHTRSEHQFAGLEAKVLNIHSGYSPFELSVNVVDDAKSMLVQWIYNASLFDEPTVVRWMENYCAGLSAITSNPHAPAKDIFAADSANGQSEVIPHACAPIR